MGEALAQKNNGLVEKDDIYQTLLENYNLKFANEYGTKSEGIPGVNEVELVFDEHDNNILAKSNSYTATKTKLKRKPLFQAFPRNDVEVY